jgi:carboxypeptidase C (cathepsin A)
METSSSPKTDQPDSPLNDTTTYGSGRDDSVTDITESVATTRHRITVKGKMIAYTARAGHFVIRDQLSGQPAAKIFYVCFTADHESASPRPVTFFYNGGPGSSSVFLLLGSFGPRRIVTNMPFFTPPAPYALEDNQETLLDESDLVFINPVGTGYSAAIAPNKNVDFWGVDQDAGAIKQFIKRYLTVYQRWNSPKFLFGESYGTPRTCVLTWKLHEDGVDLNGVTLQSCILDYAQPNLPTGMLPTCAANAWIHQKVTLSPPPENFDSFIQSVQQFARERYPAALAAYPKVNADDLRFLSQVVGIPDVVLKYWSLDVSTGNGSVFLTSLLQEQGVALGAYDGRVTADETGIAGSVDPNSGGNDPTITAVGGVYSTMWNVYLNGELKYTTVSPFIDLNDQAFANWDFGHIDPTGAQKGDHGPGGNARYPASLYTAGDLAASMELNPYLRVFCANGYYDSVTPFFQTIMDLERMPAGRHHVRKNLTIRNYHSGHMIYLDNQSRAAMKADLGEFYRGAVSEHATALAHEGPRRFSSRYRRRFGRTPY